MKRASDSDRALDDLQPRAQVLLPVRRPGRPLGQAPEAAGDRLDRRERVVDLVAEHPHEPLPRRALLGAQHPAQVGEHQQLVRQAVLAESTAAQLPAPGAARERRLERARRLALEAGAEPERARRPSPSSRSAGWPSSRSPPRFTSRSRCVAVEGEDGDVDLLDHAAEQRRGLERARAAASAAYRSAC